MDSTLAQIVDQRTTDEAGLGQGQYLPLLQLGVEIGTVRKTAVAVLEWRLLGPVVLVLLAEAAVHPELAPSLLP